MPFHQYAPIGINIDLTIDPDNNNAKVGAATSVTALSSGVLVLQTGGKTPVTRTLTGLQAGDEVTDVNGLQTFVAAGSTVTSFFVTWGPDSGISTASRAAGTNNQGAPNAGGNQAWPTLFTPLASAAVSFNLYTNAGAAATANVKATPGNLASITCENLNTATRYIQVHNLAAPPAGGAVPLLSFQVPGASGSVSGLTSVGTDTLGLQGLFFSVGITFAFSTTEWTYTAGAAGDQSTTILYV